MHVINICMQPHNNISSWLNKYWVTPWKCCLFPSLQWAVTRLSGGEGRGGGVQKQKTGHTRYLWSTKIAKRHQSESSLFSLSLKNRGSGPASDVSIVHSGTSSFYGPTIGGDQVQRELVCSDMSHFLKNWPVGDRYEAEVSLESDVLWPLTWKLV